MKHSEYKSFKLSENEEAKAKEKSEKPAVNGIFADETEKKMLNSTFLDSAFNQLSGAGERLSDFPIPSLASTESNLLFSSLCLNPKPTKDLCQGIFSNPLP